MGIRETLNKNPGIATGVTIAIIVLAIAFPKYGILWYIPPFSSVFDDTPGPITHLYYTTDDGATWFEDKADKHAPFDKDGKQAVRVYLFSCDGKKTKFVGYLERLTPDAKAKAEALQKKIESDPAAMMEMESIMQDGYEVKKKGDAKWVKRNTPEGDAIIQPSCPDGKTDNLEVVLPND